MGSEKFYNVIFYSEITPGEDVSAVKKRLAEFLNVPIGMLEGIFTGDRIVLRESLDYQTVQQFKQAFERTGALCRIEIARQITTERIILSQAAPTASSDEPLSGKNRPGKSPRSLLGLAVIILLLLIGGGSFYSLFVSSDHPVKRILGGLGKSEPEQARQELEKQGIGYNENTLIERAQQDDLNAVKLLLTASINPNVTGSYGYPALIAAIRGHGKMTAEILLENGANVNAHDKSGKTAIIVAASQGQAELLKLLLDKGADIQAKDHNEWTPLMAATITGQHELVRLLLENGADVHAQDKNGQTALILAAQHGFSDIMKMLLNEGVEVNVSTKDGETALLKAISNAHIDVVKMLIQSGADVNTTTNTGETPISLAAAGGQIDIVQLLLENGADIGLALVSAAANNTIPLVQTLLAKSGQSHVNLTDKTGYTALMYMVRQNHIGLVKALLKKGADVNIKTPNGTTALMIAAQNSYAKITQVLLEHGANVNARDTRKRTALMFAAKANHLATVEILFKNGANFTARDNEAADAQSYCYSQTHSYSTVVRFLDEARKIRSDFCKPSRTCVKIKEFRFWEGSRSPIPPFHNRNYTYAFSQSSTKYIYWQLDLHIDIYAQNKQKNLFPITAVWYNADRKVIHKQTVKVQELYDNGRDASYWGSFGWETPGKWPVGFYRVELYVEKTRVASASFEIKNSPPTLQLSGIVVNRPRYALPIVDRPNKHSHKIGKAEKGARLIILDASGEWYKVKLQNGIIGYASREYITILQ